MGTVSFRYTMYAERIRQVLVGDPETVDMQLSPLRACARRTEIRAAMFFRATDHRRRNVRSLL